MNVEKIKKIGNLKFFNNQKSKLTKLDDTFLKNINLKKIWCASSTHPGEEIICANTHIKLKKKYKNLLTIIIPRHIHRVTKIIDDIKSLDLNIVLHSSRPVSYTHLRAHETSLHLVCRLLLEKTIHLAT